MLSGYHIKFLTRISGWPIRFLIVGGQARRLCAGAPGHDLDLWVEYTEASRRDLVAVLLDWIKEHPLHVRSNTDQALTTQLADRFQIKFPEFVDCGYSDDLGGGLVSPADGIDVVIGGPSDPTFAECYARAVVVEIAPDLWVPCLGHDDAGRLPRLSAETVTFGEV